MRRLVVTGLVIPAGLLAVLALSGCRTNMAPYEAGDAGNPRKVLVAGEASEFKKDVVARVIDILGTEEWYFRIIGIDRLKREDTEQYGAILLVTEVHAGVINKKVTTFVSEDPGNPKTIVFFTRGSEEPVPEKYKLDLGVDAVSSASKDARIEVRAEQLVDLLDERF
jgi:hypothetical protein